MEEDIKLVAEVVPETNPENQLSTEAQAENPGDSKEYTPIGEVQYSGAQDSEGEGAEDYDGAVAPNGAAEGGVGGADGSFPSGKKSKKAARKEKKKAKSKNKEKEPEPEPEAPASSEAPASPDAPVEPEPEKSEEVANPLATRDTTKKGSKAKKKAKKGKGKGSDPDPSPDPVPETNADSEKQDVDSTTPSKKGGKKKKNGKGGKNEPEPTKTKSAASEDVAPPPPPPPVDEPTPPEGEESAPAKSEEPTPAEGEQPAPLEGEKSTPPEGEGPMTSEGEKPAPPESEDPTPQEAEQPAPPESEEPTPQEGEQPAPPESEEPTPQEGEQPAPAGGEESTPPEGKESVEQDSPAPPPPLPAGDEPTPAEVEGDTGGNVEPEKPADDAPAGILSEEAPNSKDSELQQDSSAQQDSSTQEDSSSPQDGSKDMSPPAPSDDGPPAVQKDSPPEGQNDDAVEQVSEEKLDDSPDSLDTEGQTDAKELPTSESAPDDQPAETPNNSGESPVADDPAPEADTAETCPGPSGEDTAASQDEGVVPTSQNGDVANQASEEEQGDIQDPVDGDQSPLETGPDDQPTPDDQPAPESTPDDQPAPEPTPDDQPASESTPDDQHAEKPSDSSEDPATDDVAPEPDTSSPAKNPAAESAEEAAIESEKSAEEQPVSEDTTGPDTGDSEKKGGQENLSGDASLPEGQNTELSSHDEPALTESELPGADGMQGQEPEPVDEKPADEKCSDDAIKGGSSDDLVEDGSNIELVVEEKSGDQPASESGNADPAVDEKPSDITADNSGSIESASEEKSGDQSVDDGKINPQVEEKPSDQPVDDSANADPQADSSEQPVDGSGNIEAASGETAGDMAPAEGESDMKEPAPAVDDESKCEGDTEPSSEEKTAPETKTQDDTPPASGEGEQPPPVDQPDSSDSHSDLEAAPEVQTQDTSFASDEGDQKDGPIVSEQDEGVQSSEDVVSQDPTQAESKPEDIPTDSCATEPTTENATQTDDTLPAAPEMPAEQKLTDDSSPADKITDELSPADKQDEQDPDATEELVLSRGTQTDVLPRSTEKLDEVPVEENLSAENDIRNEGAGDLGADDKLDSSQEATEELSRENQGEKSGDVPPDPVDVSDEKPSDKPEESDTKGGSSEEKPVESSPEDKPIPVDEQPTSCDSPGESGEKQGSVDQPADSSVGGEEAPVEEKAANCDPPEEIEVMSGAEEKPSDGSPDCEPVPIVPEAEDRQTAALTSDDPPKDDPTLAESEEALEGEQGSTEEAAQDLSTAEAPEPEVTVEEKQDDPPKEEPSSSEGEKALESEQALTEPEAPQDPPATQKEEPTKATEAEPDTAVEEKPVDVDPSPETPEGAKDELAEPAEPDAGMEKAIDTDVVAETPEVAKDELAEATEPDAAGEEKTAEPSVETPGEVKDEPAESAGPDAAVEEKPVDPSPETPEGVKDEATEEEKPVEPSAETPAEVQDETAESPEPDGIVEGEKPADPPLESHEEANGELAKDETAVEEEKPVEDSPEAPEGANDEPVESTKDEAPVEVEKAAPEPEQAGPELEQAGPEPEKPAEDSPVAEPVVPEQQSAGDVGVAGEPAEAKEEPPVDQNPAEPSSPPVDETAVVEEKPAEVAPSGDNDKKLDATEPANEDGAAQTPESAPVDVKSYEDDEGKDTVGPILGEKRDAVKTGENLCTTPDIPPDYAHDLGESVSRSDEDTTGNVERREESTELTGERLPGDCGSNATGCVSLDGQPSDPMGEEGAVSQDQLEQSLPEDMPRSDDIPTVITTTGDNPDTLESKSTEDAHTIGADGLGPALSQKASMEPIQGEIAGSDLGIAVQGNPEPSNTYIDDESFMLAPRPTSDDNSIGESVNDLASDPLKVPPKENFITAVEVSEISAPESPVDRDPDSSNAARELSSGPTQHEDSVTRNTGMSDNSPVLEKPPEIPETDLVDRLPPRAPETEDPEIGRRGTSKISPGITSRNLVDLSQQDGSIPATSESGVESTDRQILDERPTTDEDDFVLVSSSEVPDKDSLQDSQNINSLREKAESASASAVQTSAPEEQVLGHDLTIPVVSRENPSRLELPSDPAAKPEPSSELTSIPSGERLRDIESSSGDITVHDVERRVEETRGSQDLAVVEESGAVGSVLGPEKPALVTEGERLLGTETSAAIESAEKIPVSHGSRDIAPMEDSPTQQAISEGQANAPSVVTESSEPSEGAFWSPQRRKSQARRARDVPALFWPDRTVLVSCPVEDRIQTQADAKEPPAVQNPSSRGARESLRADSPAIPGMLPRSSVPDRAETGTNGQPHGLGPLKAKPPTLEPRSLRTSARTLDDSSAVGYRKTANHDFGAAAGSVMGGSAGLAIAHNASDKGMGEKAVNTATLQEAPRIFPQQGHLSESFANTKPLDSREALPAMGYSKERDLNSGIVPKNGVSLKPKKSHLSALNLGQERSDTPPIVLPTMADLPPAKPPVRGRQLRRARKLSIARAEEEIAAAVVIYASADALSPPGSPTRQARPFHFPEDGLSREPSAAARPHDWQTDSPQVADAREDDEDLRQSVADLLTDKERSSDDRDRERRRRRRSSHQSRSSRDGESSESRRHSYSSSHSRRHHRSRADSERSSRTPSDTTPPRTPARSRRHDSGYEGEGSDRSRRHRRSPEDQADHERRRERRLREKERESERDRRESRDSDRERHRRSRPGTSRSSKDVPTDDSPPKKFLGLEHARGILAGPKDVPPPPPSSSRGDALRRSNTERRSRRSEDVSGKSHHSRTGSERVRRRSEERPRSGDKTRSDRLRSDDRPRSGGKTGSVDKLRSDDKMWSEDRLRSDDRPRSGGKTGPVDKLRSDDKMRSDDRLPRKGEGDGSRAEEARRRARQEERIRAREKDDEKRGGFRATIKRIFT